MRWRGTRWVLVLVLVPLVLLNGPGVARAAGGEIAATTYGKSCIAGAVNRAYDSPPKPSGILAIDIECFLNPQNSTHDSVINAIATFPTSGTFGGASGGGCVGVYSHPPLLGQFQANGSWASFYNNTDFCSAGGMTYVLKHGQMERSTGVEVGAATEPGLPTNFVQLQLNTPNVSNTGFDSPTWKYTAVGMFMSNASGAIDLAAFGCVRATGNTRQPCNGTNVIVDYGNISTGGTGDDHTGATTWIQAEADHFANFGGFPSSACDSVPLPLADGVSGSAPVAPGELVTYTIAEADVPEDVVSIEITWADLYGGTWSAFEQTGSLGNPGTGDWEVKLLRAAFGSPTTTLNYRLRCVDESGEPVYRQPGDDWGWTDDPTPASPCSGVTITDLPSGTLLEGEETDLDVQVTKSGVIKIQIVAFGTYYVLPEPPLTTLPGDTYTVHIGPHSSDFEWRNISVRCFDNTGYGEHTIIDPSSGIVGGGSDKLFQRPLGEPTFGSCFDQDFDIDPETWAPGMGRMGVCFIARLFVPGEFHSEVFDERYEATNMITWLVPANIITDGYSQFASATGDCDIHYEMPVPIPDLNLEMCEGYVGDMRTMSRVMSTLAIGMWAASRFMSKVSRFITGETERWTEYGYDDDGSAARVQRVR